MKKCSQIDSCQFFGEAMSKMPTIAEMMKKKYCYADFDSCARQVVFTTIGKGHAPADLAPNDVERAQKIIKAKI